MDLKMLLVFIAPFLYSTLGFPIQEHNGYAGANFTGYPTMSKVTPSSDISQSIQEAELTTETDTQEDIVFNKILKANAGSTQHLREGDIVMTRSRSAIGCSDRSCFWPQSSDGIVRVPYIFAPDYDEVNIRWISEAMAEFETLTCIDFVNRTTESDYLNIKSGKGCWSNYGKVGGGQIVSVMKRGCMWKGIIQHELNHALGFLHEHARSDRDSHVKIMWEYISSVNKGNFKKSDNSNNLGLQYDYSSVMHYGNHQEADLEGFFREGGDGWFVLCESPRAMESFTEKISWEIMIMEGSAASQISRTSSMQGFENQDIDFELVSVLNPQQYWVLQIHYGGLKGTHHFYRNTFSNTPGKATIVPIPDASVPVGQRYGLSNLDVAKINKLYNCNRCSTILDTPSGSLSSDNYPSKYSGNATCFWLIRIPSKQVSLQFDAFDLQFSTACNTEYVKIYDGVSQSSEVLLNKTCGTNKPPNVTSSGKTMLVEFVRGRTGAATGFKASYTSVKIPRTR